MASSSKNPQFEPRIAAVLMSKLTSCNYSLWKSQMITFLKRHNMWNMVHGTTEEEGPTIDRRKLSINDQDCMEIIKLTISIEMLPHTLGCSTPRALWLKLETLCEIARPRLICKMTYELENLKKTSSMSMKDYCLSAKHIADSLADAESPITDADFVKHVLKGLPAEFEHVSNSVKVLPYTLTPMELHKLLVDYETKYLTQSVTQETDRKNEIKRTRRKYGFIGLACFTVGFLIGQTNGYLSGCEDCGLVLEWVPVEK